jgi:hypothetical protein
MQTNAIFIFFRENLMSHLGTIKAKDDDDDDKTRE